MRSGITERNRAHIDRLHQSVAGPFTAAEAARVLGTDLARTRRLLSWLENRGWLARVRRGLYTTVPLGARRPSEWREDPWVVASKVFDPSYIGGWSACEHWGLTDQIFRGVVVYTSKPVRSSEREIQGTKFVIRHAGARRFFGLRPVWRERVKTRFPTQLGRSPTSSMNRRSEVGSFTPRTCCASTCRENTEATRRSWSTAGVSATEQSSSVLDT